MVINLDLVLPEGTFKPRGEMIEVLETPISRVYLTKNFAFKLKKPVKIGLHDYTTLESRRAFCDKEFKINHKISPVVYIQVVPVTMEGEFFEFNGEGRTIDYAIQMVRYSSESLMTNLLRVGLVTKDDVVAIANLVWKFHNNAEVETQPRFKALSDDISRKIRDLESIHELRLTKIKQIWSKLGPLCEKEYIERLKRGHVRDVHGDLHCRNIFIVEGNPIIFDALVFKDDFRIVDVALDIGFMTMDLQFHNRLDLASEFLLTYQALSADNELRFWVPVYEGMMAVVRAWVESRDLALGNAGQVHVTQKYLEIAEKSWQRIL